MRYRRRRNPSNPPTHSTDEMDAILNQQNRRMSIASRRLSMAKKGSDIPQNPGLDISSLELFDDDEDLVAFAEEEQMLDRDLVESVGAWLKRVYGDMNIPPFEINPVTLRVLHSVALEVEQRQRRHRLLVENAKQRAVEYRAENKRLTALCESVGLSKAHLSPEGRADLAALSSVGTALGLKNLSTSCCMAGLVELTNERTAVKAELSKQSQLAKDLARKSRTSLQELTFVQQLQQRLAEERAANRKQSGDIRGVEQQWRQKLAQYKKEEQALEARLAQSGIGQDCTHEALQALGDRLAEVRREMRPVEQTLQAYNELPPDMTTANHRIQEARDRLRSLEAKFEEGIQKMQIFT